MTGEEGGEKQRNPKIVPALGELLARAATFLLKVEKTSNIL